MTNPVAPTDDKHRVPDHHFLAYPPFPAKDQTAAMVESFEDFKQEPIMMPSLPPGDYTDDDLRRGLDGWTDEAAMTGTDAYGQQLIDLSIDRTPEAVAAAKRDRSNRYNERQRLRWRVNVVDAFKIGSDPNWNEPEGTLNVDCDISRPPFNRLMDATLGFLDSRFDAFGNKRWKQLFVMIRYGFGLKTEFSGLHWPGSGSYAQKYHYTHAARRGASYEQRGLMNLDTIGESCALLRSPEQATRGFLAMARREAEAVWDIESAKKLTEIFAAFLAYLEHYEVLSDAYLAPAIRRASLMAKAASLALVQSKQIEDKIDQPDGLNHAAWVLLGGTYGNRQVVASVIAAEAEKEQVVDDDESDGGWSAPDLDLSSPGMASLTATQAIEVLQPMFDPVPVESLRQVNYLPFSRRKVVALLPPDTSSSGPAFTKTYYRLRTVPAPWTDEERWREPGRRAREGDGEEEEDEVVEEHPAIFEKEEATMEDTGDIDFWIDPAGLDMADPTWIIGMGFRARWAEIGSSIEGQSWWILKLKDYVLPAFWQSTEQERLAVQNDPAAPYPAQAVVAEPPE